MPIGRRETCLASVKHNIPDTPPDKAQDLAPLIALAEHTGAGVQYAWREFKSKASDPKTIADQQLLSFSSVSLLWETGSYNLREQGHAS